LGRKLLLGALVFVVVGLFLLIYPDPQFREIFVGGGTGGFPTTGFRFNGTIPGNFTFARNFTRGTGAAARAFGFSAISVIESLLGVGLVAVGIVFVAIELFLTPTRIK
jgi:hypothetical protein